MMEEESVQTAIYETTAFRKEGQYYYLGFLIWPFGMMVESLRRYSKPWSRNIFWLFCIYFGFTFVIAEFGGADSDRYARLFQSYATSGMGIEDLWHSFYAEGSDNIDIVSPLIIFLVSRLTANPSILFMVFALIFGYFYSRNLWFILDRLNGRMNAVILLYMVTFALLNPIWNINGFRFGLASQMFLFGMLPFLFDRDRKSLLWAVASVLVHFTFLFPVAVLGIYLLARNRIYFYLIFFIATSFIREIELGWFQNILSFLPEFLYSEVLTYTSAEYYESRSLIDQDLPWFITYSLIGLKWANYIIIGTIFIFGRRYLGEIRGLKRLLSFSLLLFGFANIMSIIPSGARFIVVANFFSFAFYILFFMRFPEIREIFIVKWFPVPFLLLFNLVALRIGMDYIGLMTIIGNPVSAALFSDPVPLIDEIKRWF